MLRKFKFDYDYENDGLLLYDPNSKTKASIEMDDFITDYNSKKEVSGIELLNASIFFKDLGNEIKINKEMLKEIQECKVDILSKNNFLVIKSLLMFKSNKQLMTHFIIHQ